MPDLEANQESRMRERERMDLVVFMARLQPALFTMSAPDQLYTSDRLSPTCLLLHLLHISGICVFADMAVTGAGCRIYAALFLLES